MYLYFNYRIFYIYMWVSVNLFSYIYWFITLRAVFVHFCCNCPLSRHCGRDNDKTKNCKNINVSVEKVTDKHMQSGKLKFLCLHFDLNNLYILLLYIYKMCTWIYIFVNISSLCPIRSGMTSFGSYKQFKFICILDHRLRKVEKILRILCAKSNWKKKKIL